MPRFLIFILLATVLQGSAYGAKTEVATQVKPDTLQEADAEALEASGIRAVRFGVYYSPDMDSLGQQAKEWPRYDRLFKLLAKHHIRVLMTAYVPPAIIADQLKEKHTEQKQGVYDSTSIQNTLHSDLDVVVRNALKRYGTQIIGVEIWNEPDNRRFWTSIKELGSFSSAMSGICDVASKWPKVPLYGFGFIFLPGGENSTTPLYDQLRQAGATKCMAVSGHFYREHAELLTSEIEAARKYTSSNVIVTELGSSSLPGTRTEASQADLDLRNVMSGIMASVPLMSIYEFKDTPDAVPDREKHFGALRSDGTPKRLYYGLKNFLSLYSVASEVSGSCKENACQFNMTAGAYKYGIFWREDETEVPLSQWIKADEIDSKKLQSSEDFYTSSPEIIMVNRSPLLVRMKAKE